MNTTKGFKPYNRTLDKKTDARYRSAVQDCLKSIGFEILEDPIHQLDGDFWAQKRGCKYRIEWEAKYVWRCSGQWELNWLTVDVPGRKFKSQADLFVMINAAGDTVCITYMEEVHRSAMQNKPTTRCLHSRQRTTDESFFTVDPTKFSWYTKDGNSWKHISYEGESE